MPYTIIPVNIGKGEQFPAPNSWPSRRTTACRAIVDRAPMERGAPISVFEVRARGTRTQGALPAAQQ